MNAQTINRPSFTSFIKGESKFDAGQLVRGLLIIFSLLFGGSQFVFGQWTSDPGVNTLVCQGPGDRLNTDIVSGENGSTIIVWTDTRNGDKADIYAQLLNADGIPQWATDGVAICTAENYQYEPYIISDGAGGAIITWYDFRSGESDIYSQRINAAGIVQWVPDGVPVCVAPGDQRHTKPIPDGDGGAMIIWTDRRNANHNDIYAQRINNNGVAQWATNGVAVCTAAGDQHTAFVTSDEKKGAIISWCDERNEGAVDIFAQKINSSGAPQWSINGVAVCTAMYDQHFPRLVPDGENGAILTWFDYRNYATTAYDIYAQRITSTGMPSWEVNGVLICNRQSNQLSPMLVSDNTGGAIIIWTDLHESLGLGDIFAQRVNAAGILLWQSNGIAICKMNGKQYYTSVVNDDSGGAIITWMDNRIDGNEFDLYAQRINADGLSKWAANGVLVSNAAFTQAAPAMVRNTKDEIIIAWTDRRRGSGVGSDIYAQNLNANGIPGCMATQVNKQPLTSQTIFKDSIPGDLVVEASGTSLKYQWFSNATASRVGATSLDAIGTKPVLKPSTGTAGILYYYCRITGNCDTVYSDFSSVQVNTPVQNPAALEIIVSPNPGESVFNILVKSPSAASFELRIIDMLGRAIDYREGYPGEIFRLGEHFSSGIYIIEVWQGRQQAVKKAIKR